MQIRYFKISTPIKIHLKLRAYIAYCANVVNSATLNAVLTVAEI